MIKLLQNMNVTQYISNIAVYMSMYGELANTITASLYWNLSGRYYRQKHSEELRANGLDIDPFAYHSIDPSNINHFSGRSEIEDRSDIGKIMNGDWDKRPPQSSGGYIQKSDIRKFENNLVYESFHDHFKKGVPWPETNLIQFVHDEIDSGNRCWGCTSRTDVQERCQRFDKLYKTINESGYKTKRELLGISINGRIVKLDKSVQRYGKSTEHITRTGSNPVRGFVGIKANEILVDVGRNGEILFVDGVHRLSIAKLLDLEEIPVTILIRHSFWIQKLQQAVNSTETLDHPDYQQIQST